MEDEIRNQILWFEALEECIIYGEFEDALEAIRAAIKLLKKKREVL